MTDSQKVDAMCARYVAHPETVDAGDTLAVCLSIDSMPRNPLLYNEEFLEQAAADDHVRRWEVVRRSMPAEEVMDLLDKEKAALWWLLDMGLGSGPEHKCICDLEAIRAIEAEVMADLIHTRRISA